MELFKEFYQECVTNDNEINTRLRYTLDLLLNGYTKKEVYEAVEEYMDYFYNKKTLENDIKDFRRIFKSVFGI
jgi:hypothetical protein